MIWKRENIKDLTELFTDGDWIETKNQSVDGIRLIQTGNIGFGKFKPKEDKKRFISPNTFEKLKCKEIYPGDILTSRLPDPVGKSCIIPDVGERMITGVDCSIIRLKPHVDKVFFCYYQMSNEYLNEVNSRVTGTTRSRISRKNLGQIKVPIPPLPEQKQIVETLDKAFEKIDKAIANIERNIQNAEEMYESKLNEIFSNSCDDWSETKMVDLCDILTCGVASTPKYVDESIGIPFLSAQNVRNGKVVLNKHGYISKKLHEHLTKKNKPSKGDILYSRVGAKFGEAAVVEHDFEFSVYVSLTLIRPKAEKLYNYYLKHLLNSPSIKSLAKSSITSSGVPNLNVKSVRDFPIRYPNLSEQIRLVGTIDGLSEHIQSLMSNYREELKNLEELKKSILEKAFKGELTSAA